MPELTCEECGRLSEGKAVGWHAFLIDVDDDGQEEPVFYCPACVEDEFQPRSDGSTTLS